MATSAAHRLSLVHPPGVAHATGRIPMLGYIRVSKAREEMISPDIQRGAITSWAAANNRVIVGWLSDLNLSGRGFAKRQIEQGIKMIEGQEAVEIGVYRYDRWGRNAADSLANVARVERVGGQVISVTEPFDVGTAIGKYSRTNALGLAEMQSDIISDNWRAALSHRIGAGLPHSGHPRFGYTYLSRKNGGDGLYHVDPVTGPLLAECYERFIGGESVDRISKLLNAGGHLTPKYRREWGPDTVRDMLDSGFAAGLIITGNGRVTGGPTPTPVYVPGAHEAIITEETFEAYRARRREVGARSPRERKATYMLTGLARCANCGGGCKHTSNRAGYTGRSVVCTRHVRTGLCRPLGRARLTVEAAVRAWMVEESGGTEQEMERERANAAKRARFDVDLALLENKRGVLAGQMTRLVDGYTREIIPEANYLERKAEIEQEAAAVERMLEQFTRGAPVPTPTEELRTLIALFDEMPAEQQNEALRRLISGVLVHQDRIVVVGLWEEQGPQAL